MLDDDGKLKRRFINKKYNAKKEGLNFLLEFSHFCEKLKEAGLVSSDLGNCGFHLARFGDCGDYTIDNCRFIWYKDNMTERKISKASRIASRNNIIAFNKSEACKNFDRSFAIKNSPKFKKYWETRKNKTIENRKIFEQTAHKSYLGKRNSQYGTIWITNGIVNKKWRMTSGDIPDGFIKGRVVGGHN